MRILSFRTSNNRGVYAGWYKDQSWTVRAAADNSLKYLRARKSQDWRFPQYKSLTENCKGWGEIRFLADRVQYRLIGYMGPGSEKFTILIPVPGKGQSVRSERRLQTSEYPKNGS